MYNVESLLNTITKLRKAAKLNDMPFDRDMAHVAESTGTKVPVPCRKRKFRGS